MARGSGGAFGTISMVAAFLAIVGFLYWLSVASEPTEFAVAVEREQPQAIALESFGGNPIGYEGLYLELAGVQVQERLGSYAFLFALPDGQPYLVRVPPALVADGLQILPGDQGTITGRVATMSEQVLEAWDRDLSFTDAAHRMLAGSMPSYFDAESVQLAPQAAPAGADAPPPGQE